MTLAVLGGTPVGSTDDHRRWPLYDEADAEATRLALLEGPYGYGGPVIERAEATMARYFGTRYCVMVSSATAGLTAVQAAVGVGRGDHVVQPAYSFGATPQSTAALGAEPEFVDIRPDTLTIDPDRIHPTSGKAKALIAVSMHGLITDAARLAKIAAAHGLPLIWDHAQAAGATAGHLTAGTTGDVTVISLNTKKILCADQGGVVLTDREDIYTAVRHYAHYGQVTVPRALPSYYTPYHGVNLAPTNQVAGLAVSRLDKLAGFVQRANRHMRTIRAGLEGLPGLTFPTIPAGALSNHSRPRIFIDGGPLGWRGSPVELRDRVITALRGEGLPVRSWQEWPLAAQPAWRRDEPYAMSPYREPGPLRPWDRHRFPATAAMLASSIMIADDPWPLWHQPGHVAEHYVKAIQKVWGELDAVMGADFAIARPEPRPEL